MTFLAPRHRSVYGALFFLISVSTLTWLSRGIAPPVTIYVAALSLGSALVSLSLWNAEKIRGSTVLLVALAGHAIALMGDTVYEDDFYRFLWDGWRLLETGTPYGVPPENFIDDPNVPPALQSILEWVNYPFYPTIYGPVLEFLFAASVLIAGADEFGLRVAFAGASLLLSALLLRRHSPERVALFAWSPLVVAESTLHLHPDIVLSLALFVGVLAGRKHPALAGIFFALAAGAKLVAFAVWPALLRLRPVALIAAILTLAALYGFFAVQGQGVGLDSTETFATQWYFNPLAFDPLLHLFGPAWGRLATLAIAGTIVVWLHARAKSFDRVPIAAIFGIILLFAPAVNAWYLIWFLPFALDRKEIWPYVASAVLPLSYLTGLNLESFALEPFDVHPTARRIEMIAIFGAILIDIWQSFDARRRNARAIKPVKTPRVSVVIPALNEESSVGQTVSGILAANPPGLCEVIVADNGSSDRTAEVASKAGAKVVSEPEKGYGAACLNALDNLDPQTNIILFMDADLSDVPEQSRSLIAPIIEGEAELVIGSRTLGKIEAGAMSAPQRFGNWLTPALVRVIWGQRYTDLGPFRAIRRDALDRLVMADRDFGWTIEMQVRAAKLGMKISERPVDYRKRVGVSKISGTISGVIGAGTKILFVIAREAFGDLGTADNRRASAAGKSEPNTPFVVTN